MAIYRANKSSIAKPDRIVVINDVKLFAQADCEESIEAFITFDTESRKIYDTIASKHPLSFQFIDLRTPYNEVFGILPL
jgi:hypothetical protein